jgi:hypothetical protein
MSMPPIGKDNRQENMPKGECQYIFFRLYIVFQELHHGKSQ